LTFEKDLLEYACSLPSPFPKDSAMKATKRPAPSSPANVAPVGDDVLQFVPETDLDPVRELLTANKDLLEIEDEDLTPAQRERIDALPSVAEMVRLASKRRLDALPPEERAKRLADPKGFAKWMEAA
jgi:hypothetical protein